MQSVIIGSGLMGTAVAYALNKLGSDIYLVDASRHAAEEARAKIEKLGGEVRKVSDAHDFLFGGNKLSDIDVAVSCAPYWENPHIALRCMESGWRYCDLGGNPDISKKIAETAIKMKEVSKGSPVFTDLGLAPGFINVLAEYGYQMVAKMGEPYAVLLRCGGLPAIKPRNSLGYALTFNAGGLYNEYTGQCDIVDWGNVITANALSDRIDVYIPSVGDFEEFHTRGGIGSSLGLMHERGVQFCNYKTLRYPGHLYYAKFLLHECQLPQDRFCDAVEQCCGQTDKDKVVIQVKVETKESYLQFKDSELQGWRRGVIINYDENWTAMQKGTAFPTAAIAYLMAQGKLDGKIVLDYSDVPLEDFKTALKEIGGLPTREIF